MQTIEQVLLFSPFFGRILNPISILMLSEGGLLTSLVNKSRVFILTYRDFAFKRIARSESHYASLPERHAKLLPTYRAHLDAMRSCVEQNAQVIKQILGACNNVFENADYINAESEAHSEGVPDASNHVAHPHTPVSVTIQTFSCTRIQYIFSTHDN